MRSPIVVKIGGAAFGEQRDFLSQIAELSATQPVVIVHGGGKLVSSWLAQHDIMPEFIRGVRYTDRATLAVATAVLAGLVNAEVTTALRAAGVNAVGLSGVSVMQGAAEQAELGYVATAAEPLASAAALFSALSGAVPVVSPLVYNAGSREADAPQHLNMNADTFAGCLSVFLQASRLVLVTDTEGVLDVSQRLIPHITPSQAEDLIEMGAIRGGMLPKIKACLTALAANGAMQAHIVDGKQPRGLIDLVDGKKVGTCIYLPKI